MIYIGLTLLADVMNAVLDPRLRDRMRPSVRHLSTRARRVLIVGGVLVIAHPRALAGAARSVCAGPDATFDAAGMAGRRHAGQPCWAPTSSGATICRG